MRFVLLIVIGLAVVLTSRGIPASFAHPVQAPQGSLALDLDASSIRRCVTKSAAGGTILIVCPDPRIATETLALSVPVQPVDPVWDGVRSMRTGEVPAPEPAPPRLAS